MNSNDPARKKVALLAMVTPLLFALHPVLALYAHNFHEVDRSDLLLPLFGLVGLTLVLYGALSLILRDGPKAGILVTAFILFSFAFSGAIGGVRSLLAPLGGAGWVTNKSFLAMWGLAFLAAGVAVLRSRRDLSVLLRTLTMMGGILVALVLVRIGILYAGTLSDGDPVAVTSVEANFESPPIPLELPADAPDVYYIVFDRYGGGLALQEFFDFDNGEFVDALRSRGFAVSDRGICNYPMTNTSLASSLNLDYLGPEFPGPVRCARMIEHNAVGHAFKAAGYRYVHLGSWYEGSRKSAFADERPRYAFFPSEFVAILIKTTPYHLFLPRDEVYRQVQHAFDVLEEEPAKPGPKFVFAHIICPHAPYVVRADGSYLDPRAAARRSETENYLDQLRFVNLRLLPLVDRILAESRVPPIIVIQADEGPLIFHEEGTFSEHEVWRRRANILNAYYLPGERRDLPEEVTPVNTFRYIFSRYFGVSLPLLEDRLLFWPETGHNGKPTEPNRPFPFVDITDRFWSEAMLPVTTSPEDD